MKLPRFFKDTTIDGQHRWWCAEERVKFNLESVMLRKIIIITYLLIRIIIGAGQVDWIERNRPMELLAPELLFDSSSSSNQGEDPVFGSTAESSDDNPDPIGDHYRNEKDEILLNIQKIELHIDSWIQELQRLQGRRMAPEASALRFVQNRLRASRRAINLQNRALETCDDILSVHYSNVEAVSQGFDPVYTEEEFMDLEEEYEIDKDLATNALSDTWRC